jgi:hypothetical protein
MQKALADEKKEISFQKCPPLATTLTTSYIKFFNGQEPTNGLLIKQ